MNRKKKKNHTNYYTMNRIGKTLNSLQITWYCTRFLKIIFVVAGSEFYFYYIYRGNKSDKERKIVRKKLSFIDTKIFNSFFKRWVQFRVGFNYTSILWSVLETKNLTKSVALNDLNSWKKLTTTSNLLLHTKLGANLI